MIIWRCQAGQERCSYQREAYPWGIGGCDDFSAGRNESIRRASGDYILWLDADDRIEPEEANKIRCLKEGFPQEKNQAYSFIVSNQSLMDGETLFRQLRIFPRIKGAHFEGRIHEPIFQHLLYEKISEALLDQGLDRLGLMASHLSFLIQPSTDGMERFLQKAGGQGSLEGALRQVEEVLAFHGISPVGKEETQRPPKNVFSDA